MNIHTHLKEKLKMMIINKKIPHIIFHGPSGRSVKIVCKNKYPK